MTSNDVTLSTRDALSIPDRLSSDARAHTKTRAKKTEPQVCLHCNKRLPLWRTFMRSRFCTPAHEKDHKNLFETLGMERLREAGNQIRRDAERRAAAAQ